MDIIEDKGFLPTEFVASETEWFYNALGFDDMYFATETVDAIASNILSLYAAKLAAFARDDKKLEIRLQKEASDHAVYIDTSKPGLSMIEGPRFEQRIDEKYIDGSRASRSYRVESFRASNALPENPSESLRCYFVYQCEFANPAPGPNETDIEKIGENRFLQKATKRTKEIYQEIINYAVARTGPVIEMFDIQGTREKRLVIAYRQGSAMGIFSALSDLYHYYGVTSSRKYVEQFSNGVTIISLYLKPAENLQNNRSPPIEAAIHQIIKEVSLLFCIPQNKLQNQFASGNLSLQEAIYAHCVHVFVQQFLNRLGSEYTSLVAALKGETTGNAELLSKIKKRLRNETFTSEYILEIINKYPELVRMLYLSFASTHYVQTRGDRDDFIPTLSYLRLNVDQVLDEPAMSTLR